MKQTHDYWKEKPVDYIRHNLTRNDFTMHFNLTCTTIDKYLIKNIRLYTEVNNLKSTIFNISPRTDFINNSRSTSYIKSIYINIYNSVNIIFKKLELIITLSSVNKKE